MRIRLQILSFLTALLVAAGAGAGQSCEPKQMSPAQLRSGMALALNVSQHLDARQARAAIVARIGRDLSEYGLRYSHIGLALRDDANARWKVVHLLNHCGKPDSALYEQGLGNFFLDDLFRFEALVLIPSVQLQARLAEAVASGEARRLHEARYSLIAHPYSDRYQNSNQWLLELTAAALAGDTSGRKAAQQRLVKDGFAPAVLHLPPLKRLGARMFAVNTRFDDHTEEERSSSRYRLVSAESVMAYLHKADRPVGQSLIGPR